MAVTSSARVLAGNRSFAKLQGDSLQASSSLRNAADFALSKVSIGWLFAVSLIQALLVPVG